MELWDGWQRVKSSAALRVATDPTRNDLVGNSVIVNRQLVESRNLTTSTMFCVEVAARKPAEQITADISGKTEEQLALLNEAGIVEAGAIVRQGDLLVGRVSGLNLDKLSQEERLRVGIFGLQEGDMVIDRSLYWTYRDPAVVVGVDTLSIERCQRVKLTVLVIRPVTEGDIIEHIPSGEKFVVGGFESLEEIDLLTARPVKHSGQDGWRKLTEQAEETWQARSVSGGYDLINQMPFNLGPTPGSKFSLREAELLASNHMLATLRELWTIKSGAVRARISAFEQMLRGEQPVTDGMPEIAKVILTYLRGLTIKPVFITDQGKELTHSAELGESEAGLKIVALMLSFASPEEIRSWSHGEVTEPVTISADNDKPERGGLFCEVVFGPEVNYCCQCGKIRGVGHKGTICDKCGVTIEDSRVRRERFGHIELAAPVVHPLMVPLIAEKLGMAQEEVEKLIYFSTAVVGESAIGTIEPGSIVPRDANLQGSQLLYGTQALDWLLARRGIGWSDWKVEVLPVIPADLRPIIQIGEERWASSDLNDLYRRVIRRNNHLKCLKKNADWERCFDDRRLLQEAVDALLANEVRDCPTTSKNSRALRSLSGGLDQYLRQLFNRRVEYAGSSVVIPDSKLKPGSIGLPKDFAVELFQASLICQIRQMTGESVKMAKKRFDAKDPEILKLLPKVVNGQLVVVIHSSTDRQPAGAVLKLVITDREAVSLHPETATAMGIDFQGEKVTVHLPLSEMAQLEANLASQTGFVFSPPDDVLSLLKERTWKDIVSWAIEGEVNFLTSFDKAALGI